MFKRLGGYFVQSPVLTEDQKKSLAKIEIPDDWKLTARETGVLMSTLKMRPAIEQITKKCDTESKISHFLRSILNTADKAEALDFLINHTTPYETGDISFDNAILQDKVYGREMSYVQRGQRLVTPTEYNHGATILKTDDGTLRFAHVYDFYCSPKISLQEFCFHDNFRLNWNTILTEEEKNAIQGALKIMHEEEVNENIESPEQLMKELYDAEFTKLIQDVSVLWKDERNVKNPDKRRIESVLFSVKENIISSKVDNKDVFEDTLVIKKSFYEQREIFCSEFQSKVTIYCWMAAQKQAFEFIAKFNPDAKVETRDKPRCLENQSNIDFRMMHPGNTMKFFEKWVDPVEKSPLFKQVVNQSDLEYSSYFI